MTEWSVKEEMRMETSGNVLLTPKSVDAMVTANEKLLERAERGHHE